MIYLRAYLNYDAISCYEGVTGQVDIYEYDDETDEHIYDNEVFESYETEEDMLERVEEINSHKYTWKDII